jgi:hypothetical protein
MKEIKPTYQITFKYFCSLDWGHVVKTITASTHAQLYKTFLKETKTICRPYSQESISTEMLQAILWDHEVDAHNNMTYPNVLEDDQ